VRDQSARLFQFSVNDWYDGSKNIFIPETEVFMIGRKDYYHAPDAPKPNSIVPAASAVVLNHDGKILLHKRKDNALWSLPGGAMELGESIEETIIREVKEETGLDVKVKN
jgi:hypothetical protein